MAREFLKGGLFDKDFMQTRVKTNRMSKSEKALGYGLGPAFTMLHVTIVATLREMYYMQVIDINTVYNNNWTYFWMNTLAAVVGILFGIVINYVAERTVAKAGRLRPWVLIGSILTSVFGVLIFITPFEVGSAGYLVWLYFTNVLYTGFALTMFELKKTSVALSSRNVLERNQVTSMRESIGNMVPGVILMFVVNMLLLSQLNADVEGHLWRILVVATGVVSLVFAFVEYFFTRERITEENRFAQSNQDAKTSAIPVKQQLKHLLGNKYFIMGVLAMMAALFYSYMQGANSRTYMITYILGQDGMGVLNEAGYSAGNNDYQMLYLIASMQPMAIGVFVIPALAKRFSARKIMLVSSVITLAGIAISLTAPNMFITAVAGGFVFACGIFAITNMYYCFSQMAGDDIEHKHGYRPEGTLANGIIVAVYSLIMVPFSAIYETVLSALGFVAPKNFESLAAIAAEEANGAQFIFKNLVNNPMSQYDGWVNGVYLQNDAVNNWMTFAYYGSYAIFAVVVLGVCIFFALEKNIPQIRADLQERSRLAAEARGEVYISPEEQDRLEMEAAAAELEAARIEELKAKCAKKGLDFDKENQKYLDKVAAEKAKQAAKEAKKNRKKASVRK